MNRRVVSLLTLAVLAVSTMIAVLSCSDDECPTCPKDEPLPPYEGWVYFTQDGDGPDIIRIDTETGEAYDSVPNDPSYPSAGYLAATPDGNYLAVKFSYQDESDLGGIPLPSEGITRIYDAQTLAPILDIPEPMHPVFPSRQDIMVGVGYDSVWVYGVPGFQRLFGDSIGLTLFPVLDERDTLIYAKYIWGTDTIDSTGFIAYNYVRREVDRIWRIYTEEGVRVSTGPFDIHPDGKRIYFLGSNPYYYPEYGGSAIWRYDLETELLTYWYPLLTTNGDVTVSPVGKDVYVVDPGGQEPWPIPGTIFIFDSDDGEYIKGISLWGRDDSVIPPGYPLRGRWVVFTPTGERAFVAAVGTILTVDTKERRIIDVTWPKLGHSPEWLALGPRL